MKFELTTDQVQDLLTILGGAKALFEEHAKGDDVPGIFKALLNNWADGAEELSTAIIEQINRD